MKDICSHCRHEVLPISEESKKKGFVPLCTDCCVKLRRVANVTIAFRKGVAKVKL